MPKQTLLDKADKRLRKVAGAAGAVVTIATAMGGVFAWASSQFAAAVSSQISEFRGEVEAANKKTETQITRLELLTLIDTQPENVVEIEKVARHYFHDLQANWYMTSIYSRWCQEHGGDPTIAIGERNG